MYGEEALNAHHILKYGLTVEFFNQFQHLKYLNIELAPIFIRIFHVWIRPFVDEHIDNENLVQRIQLESGLNSMKDVQFALSRVRGPDKDLSLELDRTTVLMPVKLAHLAFSQLRKKRVILMVHNCYDEQLLERLDLPENVDVFRFRLALKRIALKKETRINIRNQIKEILQKKQRYPEIFQHPKFERWMLSNCISAAKKIHALHRLIISQKVGVILETSEIVNPGTALSFIAQKYNIPFINAPQVLTADHALIPTRASYYCVWGNHYKRWLIARGIDEEKIVVSGNIRFEHEMKEKPKIHSKQELLEAHRIAQPFPEPLVITFASQPYDSSVQAQILSWIHEAARLPSPLLFVIRPHPADRFDYTPYVQSNVILCAPDVALYDLLRQTDLLMTISSNTAFEAALLKTGIIVLQPEIPYHYTLNYNDYHKLLVHSGAGPVVTNCEQFKRVIQLATANKSYVTKWVNQAQRCLNESLQTEKPPSQVLGSLLQKLSGFVSSTQERRE